MDLIIYLKQLTDFASRVMVFGAFWKFFEYLGMFLLFGFGLKFLGMIRLLGDSSGKSDGLCSKNNFDENLSSDCKCGLLKFSKNCNAPLSEMREEHTEKLSLYTDDDENTNTNMDYDEECDDDERGCSENDEEFDITELRELLKIEKRRTNAAYTELEKERAASATAAEEAMALILRLQNEKSLIEMEANQFRKLAEKKQLHDQEVIRSMQWLVMRQSSERTLLEDQLRLCRRMLKKYLKKCENEDPEDAEGDLSSLNPTFEDAVEDVLYSSLDMNS